MKKYSNFNEIPQFYQANYSVDVSLSYLVQFLEGLKRDSDTNLDLDPEYQRGHVWSEDKQIKFVEYFLRGGRSGRDIYFNGAGFHGHAEINECDPRAWQLTLVDGKQRLTALLRFLNDEIPAFGTLYSKYKGNTRANLPGLKIHVADFRTYKEVLEWYIDLNDGGVVHTEEEIEKVRRLINQEEKK